MQQYVVTAPVAKVSVGDPGGNRVARILRAGAIVPEGVPSGDLEALAARGLIKALTAPAPAEAPTKSAKVGDWRAYVVAAGLATEEQVAKATKEDLITLVEGPPAPPAGDQGTGDAGGDSAGDGQG